jgi:hypothetical protein
MTFGILREGRVSELLDVSTNVCFIERPVQHVIAVIDLVRGTLGIQIREDLLDADKDLPKAHRRLPPLVACRIDTQTVLEGKTFTCGTGRANFATGGAAGELVGNSRRSGKSPPDHRVSGRPGIRQSHTKRFMSPNGVF